MSPSLRFLVTVRVPCHKRGRKVYKLHVPHPAWNFSWNVEKEEKKSKREYRESPRFETSVTTRFAVRVLRTGVLGGNTGVEPIAGTAFAQETETCLTSESVSSSATVKQRRSDRRGLCLMSATELKRDRPSRLLGGRDHPPGIGCSRTNLRPPDEPGKNAERFFRVAFNCCRVSNVVRKRQVNSSLARLEREGKKKGSGLLFWTTFRERR